MYKTQGNKIMERWTLLLISICILNICQSTSMNNRNWGITEGVLKFIRDGSYYFDQEPPDTQQLLPEYDFIIVGAGSAGCALANRLSAISGWKVLLIEAGRQENYAMDIPVLANLFQFSEVNWKYKTEPSDNVCLGMTNRQCSYLRGKVVGGSSVINFMIYTRGNRRDYDNWEKLGNPGWGFKDVLPYFLQIEDMNIPELAGDKRYHSTGGEVTINYNSYRTPVGEAFVAGGRELGHRIVDYNGETQTGFSFLQTTTRNGTRWSASRAFLHPIRNRKNFHLKKNSLVTKILIDPVTKSAYGVEFINNNKKYVVRTKREVILSAGAVNSPQVLMLSGIGPRKHLQDKGISVIQDLKVGYNLMDHPGTLGLTFILNQTATLLFDDLLNDGKHLVDYLSRHEGPFSVAAGCEGIALIDTENPSSIDGDPDLELLFFGTSISVEKTLHKSLGISDSLYESVYKQYEEAYAWTAVPLTLKPKSRGRILLKSTNPSHKPLIYHDFFEHPEDLETQVVGIKTLLRLSDTKALQTYGSRIFDEPLPGCKHLPFGSDSYWACFARNLATGIWHLSGTCKMGPISDPDAVVDSRLRVYGVKGLRVIDASIMSVVPAAHTNYPAMMLGVKGADIIKSDWGVLTM
ncbi:glucose dehydrogenase [FAD, quinone]-like [Periplaneta americana]|uniref:glucose dehydrogenase [FAD, quinone]-like n=1 Tax=Periplaneta americana TaxID=6978 RepID=UPI0037E8EE33